MDITLDRNLLIRQPSLNFPWFSSRLNVFLYKIVTVAYAYVSLEQKNYIKTYVGVALLRYNTVCAEVTWRWRNIGVYVQVMRYNTECHH
jgi:hypothetical protein